MSLNELKVVDILEDLLGGCQVYDVYIPEREFKDKLSFAFVTFGSIEEAKWAVEVLASKQDERLKPTSVKAPVVLHVGPGDTRLDQDFNAKILQAYL